MPQKTMQSVKVLSIITLLIITTTSVLSLWTTERLRYFTDRTLHTENVLQLCDELYASLVQCESEARGFALTLDTFFSNSYRAYRENTLMLTDSLSLVTSDNPAQYMNVRKLDSLITERLDMYDTGIAYIFSHGTRMGLVEPDRVTQARQLNDAIRSTVRVINEHENLLFKARNEGLLRNLNYLPAILLFLSIIGIGISALNLYTVYRFKRVRAAADYRIQAYQKQLQDHINLLDASNKELEQFAYVASHDLQEPLRKIIAFSDLLNENHKDRMETEAASYLDRITNSATRMRTLINDLLNYSRASRLRYEPQQVDLENVMYLVREDIELLLNEKKAVLETEALPVVEGNETEYRQVFQNLVTNALKFAKPGIPPVIRVGSREISAGEAGAYLKPEYSRRYVMIQVKDNGIGFEQEYANKIFIIFQRLHGRDQYTGTGIGLAICKKIIEKNGGAISALSTPGEGATFIIVLPLPVPKEAEEKDSWSLG